MTQISQTQVDASLASRCPAAEWLASPLTSAEARALLARPEAIRDVIHAVKRALAECQQERIEREQCEGVKS